MEPWNRQVRPPEVNAHQPRKEHPNQNCHQGEPVVLLADDLVIQAENVFPNEAGGRRGMYYVCVR